MMKILDRSYFSPALDLACDEALLDAAEASEGGEVLRFWRPKNYFAVLGYSNAWKEEIKSRLPVYRRCSGGGAVLQGPGLLNYSLVLKIKPGVSDGIRSSNDFVMRKNRRALEKVLKKKVRVQGHTDLTLGDLKFSGNSQRRKRKHYLFHGTFLLDFDLARMERDLHIPAKQPGYRQNRPHVSFVTNIGIPEKRLKNALAEIWEAKTVLKKVPEKEIRELAKTRYSREDWNLKY